MTPNTSVNYLGGDILVFEGTGFGTDAKAVNVTFYDGTVCDVIKVTSTYFACQTERFNTSTTGTVPIKVEVNGAEDVSQTVDLLAQA